MFTYRVIMNADSMDRRFELIKGEEVTGNGNFVGKVGVLKDGTWDLVDRDVLQRVRTSDDRRSGATDRRMQADRRTVAR
jgi:hypothetical protein